MGQWEKSTHSVHVKSHSKVNVARPGCGTDGGTVGQSGGRELHVQRPRAEGGRAHGGSAYFSMGVEIRQRTQDKDAPFRQ